MLASPADLEDFAVGFSLAEGIVHGPADIISLDIVPLPEGWNAAWTWPETASTR